MYVQYVVHLLYACYVFKFISMQMNVINMWRQKGNNQLYFSQNPMKYITIHMLFFSSSNFSINRTFTFRCFLCKCVRACVCVSECVREYLLACYIYYQVVQFARKVQCLVLLDLSIEDNGLLPHYSSPLPSPLPSYQQIFYVCTFKHVQPQQRFDF